MHNLVCFVFKLLHSPFVSKKQYIFSVFYCVLALLTCFLYACKENPVIPPVKSNILFEKDSIVIRGLVPPDTFLSENYYCYEPNIKKIKVECSFATDIDTSYIYGSTTGSESVSDSARNLFFMGRNITVINSHSFTDTVNIPDTILPWRFKVEVGVFNIPRPSNKYIKAHNIKITRLE